MRNFRRSILCAFGAMAVGLLVLSPALGIINECPDCTQEGCDSKCKEVNCWVGEAAFPPFCTFFDETICIPIDDPICAWAKDSQDSGICDDVSTGSTHNEYASNERLIDRLCNSCEDEDVGVANFWECANCEQGMIQFTGVPDTKCGTSSSSS